MSDDSGATDDPGSSKDPRLLTVVTVVRNDLEGLKRTVQSLCRLLDDIDYWIIDGSSDGQIRTYVQSLGDDRIQLLSEPDDGLYAAMNKGLDRATSEYVMFLNAGDVYQPTFDPAAFLRGPERIGRVVLGYCIERYEEDRYLRPARGQEVIRGAAHPSTAYPKSVYTSMRFDLSQPISADGLFTGSAVRAAGSVFVEHCVSEFALGGRSSNYSSWSLVRQRIRDSGSNREEVALVVKTLLWAVLPRRTFYRVLARQKYEKFRPSEELPDFDARVLIAVTVPHESQRDSGARQH